MKGWRLAIGLGLFGASVLASEPVGGPESELSLELLEFLGEYGNDQGELELPDDFDGTLASPDEVTEPAAASVNGKASGTTSIAPSPTAPTPTANPKLAVESKQ